MRLLRVFLVFALLTSAFNAQGQVVTIRSEIKNATIFQSGAQISRQARVNIRPGMNELVFTALPSQVNPMSVQLTATGPITILSVNYRHNLLELPDVSEEVRILEDSAAFFTNRIDRNRASIQVLENEEALLAANRQVGGPTQGVDVVQLRTVADFVRQRLTEIKSRSIELRQQIQKDELRRNRIMDHLTSLRGRSGNIMGEVVVKVSSQTPVASTMNLTYFSTDARWTPNYDIRVSSENNYLDLILRASVFQLSGEDWNNINLTFSTGNPALPGQKPELSKWFLRPVRPVDEHVIVAYGVTRKAEGTRITLRGDTPTMQEMAQTMADEVVAQEGLTTRNFVVNVPYTIPSGKDPAVIELERTAIPAEFEYHVAPKIDPAAFLIARVANWQQFVVIQAEANLFLDGTFLGNTSVNPRQAPDTLELSLGRDPDILVWRERNRELTRRNILGNRVAETQGWEIRVRNNKNRPVNLLISDQVPISTSTEIDVTPDQLSLGVLNQGTGIVTWRMKLQPAESRTLDFRFTVRYPRGMVLNL